MTELRPVRASDGHETALEVFGAEGAPPVLFLPALGVPISYYRPFLEQWAATGHHVFGLEWRGMPHSSITNVRSTDFGYHHSLDADIPAALASMPSPPIVVAGHSLGGQFAVLHSATHPEATWPVIAIASGSAYHGTVASKRGRRIRRRQAAAVPLIVRTLGYFPGHRLGFGGRQPATVMRDWSFEAQHGTYLLAGSEVDYEAALAQYSGRALALTLEGDKLITQAAADHFSDRLLVADLTKVRLPATANEDQPFDHFRWARQNPAAILRPIEEWLRT